MRWRLKILADQPRPGRPVKLLFGRYHMCDFISECAPARLVRALCAEVHDGWLEDHRYLNMEYLKEQKKDLMRTAA